MSKKFISGAIIAAAIAQSPALSSSGTVLTIHASGFANPNGQAIAKLFVTGDNVRGPGRWQQIAHIDRSGNATFQFSGLAARSYAVVVFHDKNDNGIIDHGMFGPSEPLGFSGGYKLSMLSGLPTFDKLKFEFKGPDQVVGIQVQ
jgi:uncharacterized protein (DUF2141 family)